MWLLITSTLLIVYMTVKCWKKHMQRRVLPPGPKGWPIIGNVLQLNFHDPRQLLDTLADWGEKFGGVYTINLLGTNIVVVSSVSGMQV